MSSLTPALAGANTIFHCQDERQRPIFSDRPCSDNAIPVTLEVPATQGINYDTTERQKQAVETLLDDQRKALAAQKEAEQKKAEVARQAAARVQAEQERQAAATPSVIVVRPTLGYGNKGWFAPDKRSHYYPVRPPHRPARQDNGFVPYQLQHNSQHSSQTRIEYRPPLRAPAKRQGF